MEGGRCNSYEKFQDDWIINWDGITEQSKRSCLFCEQEIEKGDNLN